MANKKIETGVCIYCNAPVTSDDPEVALVKTRRKSTILFHEKCFYEQGNHLRAGKEVNNAE